MFFLFCRISVIILGFIKGFRGGWGLKVGLGDVGILSIGGFRVFYLDRDFLCFFFLDIV